MICHGAYEMSMSVWNNLGVDMICWEYSLATKICAWHFQISQSKTARIFVKDEVHLLVLRRPIFVKSLNLNEIYNF